MLTEVRHLIFESDTDESSPAYVPRTQGPANGFALLGQEHSAHAAFAKRTNDPIPAEVVISGGRGRCIDRLSFGFFRSGRTIESTEDKTLRARPAGSSEPNSAPH